MTLVGNDTGGALCQIVATRRPERIGAPRADLVRRLRQLPAAASSASCWRPRASPGVIPVAFGAAAAAAAAAAADRLRLAHERPIDRDAEDSYVLPVLTARRIRRDVRKLLGGLDTRLHARGGGEAGRAGTGRR